jgi:hypothetical protein
MSLVLFAVFDPFSWAAIILLGKTLLIAGAGAAVVLAVLNWSRIVAWFQGNAHHIHSDPNNIAVMVKQAERNGKVGHVNGIFNKVTERVVASQGYIVDSLDEETKQKFGTNDVCIVQ